MELKLVNGTYVPGAGGRLRRVTGAEETAQRVMMKLTARRGGFAPLPDYGSALHTLFRTAKPSAYQTAAMRYIAEALADEPEVTVTDVEVIRTGEESLRVEVGFTVSGVAFRKSVEV